MRIGAPRRCHELFQGPPQQLLLLVAHVVPAPVGVTDQPGGIRDQDQALRVVQNLAGEVALALQLRLEVLQPADIEHQTAELRNPPLGVAHRESIDEHVDHRSVAAAERLFVVAHYAVLFHLSRQFLMALGREINLGANVDLQQIFPAAVAEHADQCVVDFDEAAVGRGEEQSFLNVVEQFPVSLLHFQAVADVLQHVDGLHAFAAGAVHAGSRNQVGAFQHGMNVFVISVRWCCGRKGRSAAAVHRPWPAGPTC